ncbi:basic phospholipase A2 Ts-G6D49-like protein [Leptotrombidium deliense]|uniref:Phospholipase A2 n=1 Tax=Leptotrombidium deliense TaxID=299467 RepID=A0A443SEV1_9ACAR|nr:basic phospholipase A2 Ts-G6D49-like protein [Leptotrombidium deliense]
MCAHFINANLAKSNEFSNSHNSSVANTTHRRAKRSILQLASMIKCVTGCDAMLYKGYGCYCGYSGRGVPVDLIDE